MLQFVRRRSLVGRQLSPKSDGSGIRGLICDVRQPEEAPLRLSGTGQGGYRDGRARWRAGIGYTGDRRQIVRIAHPGATPPNGSAPVRHQSPMYGCVRSKAGPMSADCWRPQSRSTSRRPITSELLTLSWSNFPKLGQSREVVKSVLLDWYLLRFHFIFIALMRGK